MIDMEKIEEIFSELRNFADNDVHPVVSPENWHVYSKLRDLIDEAEENAIALLKEQPEIIWCKDCKHYENSGWFTQCFRHNGISPNSDWFCADGERKD